MKRIIAFILCLSLTACAGWRSHIDINAKRYKEVRSNFDRDPQKRLLLSISAEHKDAMAEAQSGSSEKWRNSSVKWFKKSGLFSEVGVYLDDYDLEMVLHITEEEHYNKVLTALCGITLLIIPTYDRVTIDCDGTVYDSEGEELQEINVDEEVSVIIGWLVLPAMPTAFIAIDRGNKDVFKSIAVQMMENDSVWE